jgi:glycosyltransferase involved in cell wall biosynthesis
LLWDFYEEAFDKIPVRLVGYNPDMAGFKAANSWEHVKRTLQSHRFYIHTANPELEDGYNISSLEAMAAGLPILGNRHPTTPIEHGVSGFLSDDPAELHKYANMLLEDKVMATMMGQEAQKTAMEQFSITSFKEAFLQSIETARQKWKKRKLNR